jgi:predicted O-methyltransferase YrrM
MAALKQQVVGLAHDIPGLARLIYRVAYGPLGPYLAAARPIPGWLGRNEGLALARICYNLPPDAVAVEIGSFLGKSAIVLAGARKLRGSGALHCVDPFDASGDAFSAPVYRSIASEQTRSLRQRFDDHIAAAGLTEWVQVHQGTAAAVAAGWTQPIDLLFLDGDQSPAGARLAYDTWAPFLKVGGFIALHNSTARTYAPGHDGHHLLAMNLVGPPHYGEIRGVESTTVARKLA